MTTVIAPSAGAAPLFTQQGQGTTPGYAALDERRATNGALQEGVFGTATAITAGGVAGVVAADFMVTQRGAGANMSVDINMPTGGAAYVQGDTIGDQGLYRVPVHSATINEAIAAADATNPRVDQVILEVQDNVLDASGGNLARVRVLTGTPFAGTNLTTRNGAVALPGSALLLADILVPNSSSSVTNTNIRDRRKWARGACVAVARTAGNYTTASSSAVNVDSTNLAPRVECSGVPLRLSLDGVAASSTTGASAILVAFAQDGTGVMREDYGEPTAGLQVPVAAHGVITPSAGSHQFTPQFANLAAGTTTLFATSSSDNELFFYLEEIVRANVANGNGVTSG